MVESSLKVRVSVTVKSNEKQSVVNIYSFYLTSFLVCESNNIDNNYCHLFIRLIVCNISRAWKFLKNPRSIIACF